MLTRYGVFFLAAATAIGGTYPVPYLTTPGNYPVPVGATAERLQEIIGSGQFNGPMVITGLRFRAAVGAGPVSLNYPSFQVTLSTTQAFPNTNNNHTLPSATFASNVGPDATKVFSGPVSASSPGCTGNAACPFDLAIPFSVPFSFDPNKGRLLVDLVNSDASGTPTGSLDGVQFPNSNSSSAATVAGGPGDINGKLALIGLVLGLDTTTPQISDVQNVASNIPIGLPNASLAQGAVFVVKGVSLGPSNIAFAASPFQGTSVSGTSVAVTVGATTSNALMYYASDGQVAALLPSNTPTGSGNLTVTSNGQTSATASVNIIANNLGIFTIDSSGQGPGILTYGDYSLVSAVKADNCGGPNTACGAANPGDALILWATGLGPVGGSDASGAGLGVNMPNIPLTLWLGGVKITPSYQGRSGCCIGEDQIVFTVPNNVPTGCIVPLIAQIGNQVSNTVGVPVAVGSRNCSPTVTPYAGLTPPSGLSNPITTGDISLYHFSDGGGAFEDHAKFQFIKVPSIDPGIAPFIISWIDIPPLGTCTVYNNLNENQSVPITGITLADAGSTFTINGPNGKQSLPTSGGKNQLFDSKGAFLVPGAYTVTGAGGADIGPLNANLTIPSLPTLTAPSNNAVVARSSGLTLTWTGGTGNLYIEVFAPSDTSGANGAAALCNVAASTGTFTIPPYVMLALPPTPNNFSSGLVMSSIAINSFSATGLTVGSISDYYNVAGFGFGWGSGGFTLR